MSKQTAVEWLWEQIDNTIPFQNIQTSQIFNGLLDKAKEMEKQQIMDAHYAPKYGCFNKFIFYLFRTILRRNF